jgi:excisionase family DNA binding protein
MFKSWPARSVLVRSLMKLNRGNVEELFSPKELSKMLKVSKPWPYIMVKRGILPCYRLGGLIRFKRGDIEAFLERSRVEGRRIVNP